MDSITSPEDPLHSFASLSSTVCMRDPSNNGTSLVGPAPMTIVILFWMNSGSRQRAKFLSKYAKLAPKSQIIAVTTTIADFTYRSSIAYQRRRFQTVVDAIRASINIGSSVFLHAFSNAGVFATKHLSSAFLHATGRQLPLRSMVIDSAPGKASFSVLLTVLSYVIPKSGFRRFLGNIIVYTLTSIYWAMTRILRMEDEVMASRRAINDSSLVPENIERCYIYSDKDELVMGKDVEENAAEAERKGWIVTKEKFDDTPHVGHMRADPERYWKIVTRIMNGPDN